MLTIGYRFIVFQNISFKIYTFLHAFESIVEALLTEISPKHAF